MRLKQALLAAVLAASATTFALPTAAQSSASAFLGNLAYELIDLTPDDGSTPYITFTGNTTTSATSNLYADPDFTQLAATLTMFGTDFGTTYVNNADGTASAAASPFGVGADVLMMSNSGFAQTSSTVDFILSANTRVIFTVFGSVEAMPDFFNDGYAYAYAGMYGELQNDASDGVNNFGASMYSLFLREERYLAASGQTQGLESSGWLGMQSIVEGATMAAPVPEPGSVAMLAAGLGMLAGAARRRAARG
jgi:hypothetical protein